MGIEFLRDLIIVIAGLMFILALILAVAGSYIAYRKVNRILKSAQTTAAEIESLSIIAGDGIGKPLARVAGLAQGIAYGIGAMSKIFARGEKDGGE